MPLRTLLRTLIPIFAAGVVGAYSVVAVNAWMNVPTRFTLDSTGNVTDVHPMRVLFNRMALLQFAHMWVGAFMLVGFVVASVYAVGIRRGRSDSHHRLGFVVPFAFASVASSASGIWWSFAAMTVVYGAMTLGGADTFRIYQLRAPE